MPKGADRSKMSKKTVLELREMPIIEPLSAANRFIWSGCGEYALQTN